MNNTKKVWQQYKKVISYFVTFESGGNNEKRIEYRKGTFDKVVLITTYKQEKIDQIVFNSFDEYELFFNKFDKNNFDELSIYGFNKMFNYIKGVV